MLRSIRLLLAACCLSLALSGVAQAQTCATPGLDGAGGTLGGVVNTYYPGTARARSGNKTISLGAATGALTPIAAGDLLLIIQMQGATINTSNNSNYGAGTGTGAGYTAATAGKYEFIKATNAVGLAGGTLTISSALINTYNVTVASHILFQVVRVPQYTTATLSSSLTAAAWTIDAVTGYGTGGILAIDVAGTLTLGGATVSVNGKGFRGGGARQLNGGGGGSNTDYVTAATNNFHASKGEGIAGTPRYIYDAVTSSVIDTGSEGYSGGSFARGAPGNAGGGGDDGNPAANDQNSGGGGGGNGGAGGTGGNTWSSNLAVGGIGGAAFTHPTVAGELVLGGGGGAGTRNNSSGVMSSGGAGGGLVMIRVGSVSGSGTITANGAAGTSAENDGGGGGGAGGSILFYAANGSLSGLNLVARGGRGGDAWPTQAPGGFPGNRHGPGGGGGGGFIVQSGGATIDVSGGAGGVTTTAADYYGATGNAGLGINNPVTESNIPGTDGGASCIPQLSLSKSVSPAGSQIPGTDLTYTITFTNTGGAAARSLIIADQIPANTDFKTGSAASTFPAGLTVAVEYSNNNGSTWSYTPASGGGGAPAGYDRSVTNIRWRVSAGNLSQTAPNNTGNVSFTARIR
jgi:uncharacterized repeat protein (TIGR01451 family)